jgi:hypothetical protein
VVSFLQEVLSGLGEEEQDHDRHEGSKELETQISVRAQGGNAPDIAIFPQPGLLRDLASRDYIQLEPAAAAANVREELVRRTGPVTPHLAEPPTSPADGASVKGFICTPWRNSRRGVEVLKTYAELHPDEDHPGEDRQGLVVLASALMQQRLARNRLVEDSRAAPGWCRNLRQVGHHKIPFTDSGHQ